MISEIVKAINVSTGIVFSIAILTTFEVDIYYIYM